MTLRSFFSIELITIFNFRRSRYYLLVRLFFWLEHLFKQNSFFSSSINFVHVFFTQLTSQEERKYKTCKLLINICAIFDSNHTHTYALKDRSWNDKQFLTVNYRITANAINTYISSNYWEFGAFFCWNVLEFSRNLGAHMLLMCCLFDLPLKCFLSLSLSFSSCSVICAKQIKKRIYVKHGEWYVFVHVLIAGIFVSLFVCFRFIMSELNWSNSGKENT